jgi:HAD superfamily hydrolase (TIGR01509 family)
MSRFKNIIFDLDGLIVDTEPLHQRALNHLLALVGAEHQFETEEYGRIFTGLPIFENSEYLRERFSLPQTAAQISNAHHALFTLLVADAENLEPMAGVQNLLDWLTANQFGIGIASSSRPEQVELIIRNLNLHPHFVCLVGNDGSLKPKPDPDVYLLALKTLGVPAHETVALEDSSSGVRAAHAAGLYVIAVPNAFTARQDFSKADLILENLDRVKDYLESASE